MTSVASQMKRTQSQPSRLPCIVNALPMSRHSCHIRRNAPVMCIEGCSIAVDLSLAYIGTASGTGIIVSLVVDPRRFRLGDEKEAAGGAVAVIQVGIMEIESRLVIGKSLFGAAMVSDGDGKR